MHTEKDHASKGGVHIEDKGHKWRKKYTINAARDACPDGNEYLSGPMASGSLKALRAGRLLLVIALITQTKMMSSTNPEMIFLLIYPILSNRINQL